MLLGCHSPQLGSTHQTPLMMNLYSWRPFDKTIEIVYRSSIMLSLCALGSHALNEPATYTSLPASAWI